MFFHPQRGRQSASRELQMVVVIGNWVRFAGEPLPRLKRFRHFASRPLRVAGEMGSFSYFSFFTTLSRS